MCLTFARTRGGLPSLGCSMMPTPSLLADPSIPIPIIVFLGAGGMSVYLLAHCMFGNNDIRGAECAFLSAALSIGCGDGTAGGWQLRHLSDGSPKCPF